MLEKSSSKDIISLVKQLNYNVKVIEDCENYDIYQLNKIRTIDPSMFIDNKIYKASEKSKTIKALNANALEKCKKGVYVRILKNK